MTIIDTAQPFVRAYAPGRTELAGNHMDHQGGRVVAATIDCGLQVDAQPLDGTDIIVQSDGFAPVVMNVDDIAPRAGDHNATIGLVRGVVAGLRAAGVEVGGLAARVTSTIPVGGGFSSSAAFELAFACALTCLAQRSNASTPQLDALQLARIGLAAERDFFGKPCGLMDQLAIACGGINELDFAPVVSAAPGHEGFPTVKPLAFDFEQAGYVLLFVDTHCDHSRYADEFARLANDMADVARFLGCTALCELDRADYFSRMSDVRRELGDLRALRGLHFYHELELVDARAHALRAGDMQAFIAATKSSSASSAQYLQNVTTPKRDAQPAMVALALADCLAEPCGAARIHGGGFGGSIQVFVALEQADAFMHAIDDMLGAGSCKRHRIVQAKANAAWIE